MYQLPNNAVFVGTIFQYSINGPPKYADITPCVAFLVAMQET